MAKTTVQPVRRSGKKRKGRRGIRVNNKSSLSFLRNSNRSNERGIERKQEAVDHISNILARRGAKDAGGAAEQIVCLERPDFSEKTR